jgi:hypothetical protein
MMDGMNRIWIAAALALFASNAAPLHAGAAEAAAPVVVELFTSQGLAAPARRPTRSLASWRSAGT